MSEHDPIPERLREYFGHDKVAHHGSGGMPAAPPAPPGSTARKAGETALADGLSKAGTPGRAARRDSPRRCRPGPRLPRRMRAGGERALMEASHAPPRPGVGPPAPHAAAGWFWRSVFAPSTRAIPWGDQAADGRDDLGGQGLAPATLNASAGQPRPAEARVDHVLRAVGLVAQVHDVARQAHLRALRVAQDHEAGRGRRPMAGEPAGAQPPRSSRCWTTNGPCDHHLPDAAAHVRLEPLPVPRPDRPPAGVRWTRAAGSRPPDAVPTSPAMTLPPPRSRRRAVAAAALAAGGATAARPVAGRRRPPHRRPRADRRPTAPAPGAARAARLGFTFIGPAGWPATASGIVAVRRPRPRAGRLGRAAASCRALLTGGTLRTGEAPAPCGCCCPPRPPERAVLEPRRLAACSGVRANGRSVTPLRAGAAYTHPGAARRPPRA